MRFLVCKTAVVCRKILIDTGEQNVPKFIELLHEALGSATLECILITHWHPDHVGGISDVQKLVGGACPVYKLRRAGETAAQGSYTYVDDGFEVSWRTGSGTCERARSDTSRLKPTTPLCASSTRPATRSITPPSGSPRSARSSAVTACLAKALQSLKIYTRICAASARCSRSNRPSFIQVRAPIACRLRLQAFRPRQSGRRATRENRRVHCASAEARDANHRVAAATRASDAYGSHKRHLHGAQLATRFLVFTPSLGRELVFKNRRHGERQASSHKTRQRRPSARCGRREIREYSAIAKKSLSSILFIIK